jgi:hypothetical protein
MEIGLLSKNLIDQRELKKDIIKKEEDMCGLKDIGNGAQYSRHIFGRMVIGLKKEEIIFGLMVIGLKLMVVIFG